MKNPSIPSKISIPVSQRYAWALFIGLVIVWGSSFILIKNGLKYYSPQQVGTLRIAAAGWVLAIPAFFYIRKIALNKILVLLGSGLLGNLIPSFLFSAAQTQLSSSVAGILNALTPLFTFVIGILFFNQKSSNQKLIGLGVGFLGLCMFVLGKENNTFGINQYALLVILATVCYGLNINIAKKFLGNVLPMEAASISLLMVGSFATVYLFGATDFMEITKKMDSETLMKGFGSVVVLGVIGSAGASIIFYRLVQVSSPVFASSVTYFIPIVAVLWGVTLMDESLFFFHYIGMAAIILGVFIVNRSK
jgi:drug/metabolite transporter (DMT)-like permease